MLKNIFLMVIFISFISLSFYSYFLTKQQTLWEEANCQKSSEQTYENGETYGKIALSQCGSYNCKVNKYQTILSCKDGKTRYKFRSEYKTN